MSSPQEYWDACLIRTWRNLGTIRDANSMFRSITGEWPDKIEPPLLRLPKRALPITVQARYFVAHFMPKLNDMLLNSDRDKDVLILRKLKDSKYNTAKKQDVSIADRERFAKEGRQMYVDKKAISVGIKMYSERNDGTNWNVNKGPVRQKVRRR